MLTRFAYSVNFNQNYISQSNHNKQRETMHLYCINRAYSDFTNTECKHSLQSTKIPNQICRCNTTTHMCVAQIIVAWLSKTTYHSQITISNARLCIYIVSIVLILTSQTQNVSTVYSQLRSQIKYANAIPRHTCAWLKL
jgi:hypothetical protein